MIRYLFYTLVIALVSLPWQLLAQERRDYQPLIGVPGLSDGGEYTVSAYISILYVLAISLAAFLAVVKLILAGLKYILSDVITQKADAKQDIRSALIGLLIVLGAVLLLNTINPNLTNLNALDLDQVTAVFYEQRIEVVDVPQDAAETGLDGLDLSTATEEQIRAAIAACTGAEPPGRWVVRPNDQGVCLGNEADSSSDNIINTPAVLDAYFAKNPNLDAAERAIIVSQYNQYVGTQEPDELNQALIDAIADEQGASEVLFVVQPLPVPPPFELIGYDSQQEALCQRFTGSAGRSDNIVSGNGYVACVR